MFFIDTHCHINSDQLRADAEHIVERAKNAGVKRILVVGADLRSSIEAVRLACRYKQEGVYAAVGVHPHDAKTVEFGLPEELLRLADEERVVAIGETGLDYYYDHSSRDVQQNVFRLHIAWASQVGKPLVVHVRDAMEDALGIIRNADPKGLKLLFHCYAGGLDHLEDMKELDTYMALGGPVTWPKNGELREVAARLPENRLLCETDAPWLTPAPHRGKLNEPANVRYVYEAVAAARGVSLEVLARLVDANASSFFGWGMLHD